jgi:magnesium-transporting ATPase (P-type)
MICSARACRPAPRQLLQRPPSRRHRPRRRPLSLSPHPQHPPSHRTARTEEAKRRLRDFGPNALTPPHKAGFFERLWRQINNIVIWILFAAAIVEGAFQSWAEFGLVLLVIVANTAIGLVRSGGCWCGAAAVQHSQQPPVHTCTHARNLI